MAGQSEPGPGEANARTVRGADPVPIGGDGESERAATSCRTATLMRWEPVPPAFAISPTPTAAGSGSFHVALGRVCVIIVGIEPAIELGLVDTE